MKKTLLGLAIAALLLSGCKQADEAASTSPAASASRDAAMTETAPAAAGFDIEKVPMSTATLGDFPYITLPAGYTNKGYGQTNKDFARFPFWVDGQAHWVEGRFHGEVFTSEDGKDFSPLEVARNFEAMIRQMGGVKVSEGRITQEAIEGWGSEIKQGFVDGLGDVYNNPATVYVVRRPEGNIWVHLVTTSAAGAYVVGQEKAFQQTAQLLPASELKKQIDAAGKVALQVNFATGKTDVLPDSLPQIEQVVALLKEDPALELAVNGHTDDSGDAAHNRQLSEGRAKAVVALLVGQGVDAARLTAAGFGSAQPVAENTTAEGKAKNRRVELVKH